MVYESDFYTTRRPYTRPISSHYTVTNPGAIIRPMPPLQQQQHFDDETREIRARADSLLRRIHVFVPRPSSSDFAEVIVPERMRSDDYIRRVLTARKNAKKDEEPVNYYESPDTRHFGNGHLASVSYTGGKPHSRRRPYYKLNDLRAADVQSDVNLLSFYAKNRQAAASASRALADDRVYAPPRKASPDPEPIYKPDLATVYEPEEVVERKPKKAVKAEKKSKVHRVIEREPIVESQTVEQTEPKTIAKSEPIIEPEPEPIAEPEPEPIVEPETIAEPEPEPIIESESEPIIEPEIEQVVESEKEIEQIVEPESETKEPLESEIINESTHVVEVESEVEPKASEIQAEVGWGDSEGEQWPGTDTTDGEPPVVPTSTEEPNVQNDDNEMTDENPEDDEVLQRKLDEEELRRQVEELKRQAEEEKRRQAEEARLAEERYKAEIEERVRLEEEARQARLREIEEQERLEAERQAEDIRIETERLRDLKIVEEQKRAAEYEATLALEEEERYIIEKAAEDARKREELEEKLASEVVGGGPDEDNAPESTFDECHCHDNVKSQDHEERPDTPDADNDTQVEEEPECISTDHDELSDHPYDGEHEGFNSVQELDVPIENIPQVEEIDSEENDEQA
ncbi:hypothetical protein PV327_000978 [Microctonus hyperodae]|uniref:Uncharacterized protein n=1 Tax=Microctonus hyperodae TaxID=165561 RepID=A0AA39L2Y1_MICHY|nr:hypothetical protein PV327_000978 [Microctonus hyperodae]